MRSPLTKLALVIVVVLVVPILVLGTIAAVDDADSSSDGTRTTTRFDHTVLTGQMQEMLERHQAMMERMRVGATPEHLQMMDADPMWQQMRSGEFAQLMEQHQEQLDRMLGRGG